MKKNPIAYPRIPPKTDETEQMAAKINALVRLAMTMGISMKSGGKGKNELSAKATAAKIQRADGLLA